MFYFFKEKVMSCVKTFSIISRVRVFIFFFTVSLYSQNLLDGPNDIVFNVSNNHYLVANWAGNSIVAIDSLGNQSFYRSNITHAHGMEVKDSILFVASYHNLLLINVNSSYTFLSIFVPGSEYLGHVALDSSHYVYITDWSAKKLFRINLNNQTTATLYTFNQIPGGISFEENNNRLIMLTFVNDAPILAYNLTGGNIDTVRNTNIDEPDAICKDSNGDYYVTSFSENVVYRFDGDFSSGPEIISTGHGGPSGIGYNKPDNIIGVTNYNFKSIDLIQLSPNNVGGETNIRPEGYYLFQNYPNPFNPITTIKYQIPEPSFVSIKVYGVLGNEIVTLVNEEKTTRSYWIDFDAVDLSSGIYFYRLKVYPENSGAELYSKTRKMLLIK